MSESLDEERRKKKVDEYGNVIREVGEDVKRDAGEAKSEAEKGLSGMRDKIKAGAKAMGSKIGDSSKDLGTEYDKNKTDEELKD